jgi:Tol biopolymer transport system component
MLQSGGRLGPYEIIAPLGAGGMGEVYRARDTKLDRHVALKILPDSFASDADRLMRFEREAKTLASLNHPNIAAIYGIEHRTLVMELVEGEDLSERIARGAVPIDEALPIARQIAEALEAAHEAGVIHRDLKPANIKIRHDGTVKVLDFGLAKAMVPDPESSGSPPVYSPTMTSPALTAMGLILGTAAYMSPEQAKGRPIDKRADIWAFGVVLYEMVTGRRLFDAEDMSETLAAVLTRDVSATALPAEIPSRLRALVSDCLVRDPRRRLRDMGDVRLLLDRIDEAPGPAAPAPPAAAARAPRWLWASVALLGTLVAVGMPALYLSRPIADPPEVITFEVSAPDLSAIDAISPDGRQLLYGSIPSEGQPARLWLRSLVSLDARPVPGTEALRWRVGSVLIRPVWSPDSRAAVVSGRDALIRVDTVTGHTSALVAGAGRLIIPGAWSREGVVLFGEWVSAEGGVRRVAETGGQTDRVTELRPGELFHLPSAFLPDGRRFLYFSRSSAFEITGEVRIGSIDVEPAAQGTTALMTADGPAVYAAGHLLFVSRGSLMAQPFDPIRAELSGKPVELASGVAPVVSASENGRLSYREAGDEADALSELVRYDRSGRILEKIGPPAVYSDVNVVGPGRLAVGRVDRGEPSHLRVVDIARGVFSRLSPGNNADFAAAPAPDDTIAYTFSPDGISRDIYVRAANGVGEARRLVASESVKHPNDWTPDGRFLMYDEHTPRRAQDLLLVPKEGGESMPFLTTDADETFAQFSPDGKWVAYSSTESSRAEIYVRDFAPDRTPAYGTAKVQISVNGGEKPRWSPGGREIYFLQGNTMMAVPVQPGTPFQAGTARALFDTRPASYVPYDVMPDGTFIVNTRVESRATAARPLRVMLNWPSTLKK